MVSLFNLCLLSRYETGWNRIKWFKYKKIRWGKQSRQWHFIKIKNFESCVYVFYSSLCLLTFHSTLNKIYYNMSGSRLYTEGFEMNDIVFAVFRWHFQTLFHLIFFNNTLRYVSLSLFQRCRNGLWKFKQLAWGQVVSKWRTWNGSMTPRPYSLSHASGTGYCLLKESRGKTVIF